MINITYNISVSNCALTKKEASKLISKACEVLKCNGSEVELNIVGDYLITKLNKNYRGINKKTDVLAFAWQEDKKIKSSFLGQIYICYPQIIRQAKYYGITPAEEMGRMIIHGLLHLLGYDHQVKRQAKIMFDLQEKIIDYGYKK